MRVLIDNNISPHIAVALHAIVAPHGHEVVALRSKFPSNATDEAWIAALGKEGGWSVISGDRRITRSAAERHAWRRTQLIGYFFAPGWRKLDTLHQTARLLLWWDKLVIQSALVSGGSIFELPVKASSRLRPLPL